MTIRFCSQQPHTRKHGKKACEMHEKPGLRIAGSSDAWLLFYPALLKVKVLHVPMHNEHGELALSISISIEN